MAADEPLADETGGGSPEPILTGRDLTWREQLRLAWRTPILIVSVALTILLVYPLGIYWGINMGDPAIQRQELSQERAVTAQKAVFDHCFDKFVRSIRPRDRRESRSGDCFEISETALNGVYQARLGQ